MSKSIYDRLSEGKKPSKLKSKPDGSDKLDPTSKSNSKAFSALLQTLVMEDYRFCSCPVIFNKNGG